MNILGISAFYHDSAAAIVCDGRLVAAVQQERFSRCVHDPSFPIDAILSCLDIGGISLDEIDAVAFYDDPQLKWRRIVDCSTSYGVGKGVSTWWSAFSRWCGTDSPIDGVARGMAEVSRRSGGPRFAGEIRYLAHHLSHAASTFLPSPFEKAAILTMDGVGEYATTSIGLGDGKNVTLLKQINFPHSLGMLYSAFTYYLGFKVNSGEYKVMGLAPYGDPGYVDRFEKLIRWNDDGSYALALEYFDFFVADRPTAPLLHDLFDGPPRKPESPLTQRECDIARSLQAVIEEGVLRLARHAREITGASNLCLAGGVALNCVANGRLVKEKIFDNVWIQPAAGDAGGAVGAALFVWCERPDSVRIVEPDTGNRAYLGPVFDNGTIEKLLLKKGYPHRRFDESQLLVEVSALLAQQKVVGWFWGPMEFGPRALGHRSILADPRAQQMQSIVNTKIKYRESFRPFAPIVLEEKTDNWFDLRVPSPYMLLVGQVLPTHCLDNAAQRHGLVGVEKRSVPYSTVPAITHVDGSARLQTVSANSNPRLYSLLQAFEERTGCPILLNTSFNVRDEPIVCSPEDAYDCFMRTDIDVLVLGDFVLMKSDQSPYFGPKSSLFEMYN
jgi:carbamoyltransferase